MVRRHLSIQRLDPKTCHELASHTSFPWETFRAIARGMGSALWEPAIFPPSWVRCTPTLASCTYGFLTLFRLKLVACALIGGRSGYGGGLAKLPKSTERGCVPGRLVTQLFQPASSRGTKGNSPGDKSHRWTLAKVVSSGISPSPCRGANIVCKREITSEISGRRCGLWSQHCSVRSQISSVKFGSAGRAGRFPDRMSTATVVGLTSWNGTSPVNIFLR